MEPRPGGLRSNYRERKCSIFREAMGINSGLSSNSRYQGWVLLSESQPGSEENWENRNRLRELPNQTLVPRHLPRPQTCQPARGKDLVIDCVLDSPGISLGHLFLRRFVDARSSFEEPAGLRPPRSTKIGARQSDSWVQRSWEACTSKGFRSPQWAVCKTQNGMSRVSLPARHVTARIPERGFGTTGATNCRPSSVS